MGFWVRYAVLVLLCIVAPLTLAFFEDTRSELRRATSAGEVAAKGAPKILRSQLALRSQQSIHDAVALARAVGSERLLPPKKSAGLPKTSVSKLFHLLDEKGAAYQLVWAVDEDGAIFARAGRGVPEENPQLITGHPLFRRTQEGFGLDGFWKHDGKLYLIAAAPIVRSEGAQGAVLLGTEVSESFVTNVAQGLGTALTVVQDEKIIASTIKLPIAEAVVASLDNSGDARLGGRFEEPLASSLAGLLPMFVPKDGDGIAYTSIGHDAPGNDGVLFVVSVSSRELLGEVDSRQKNVLGIMAAALLASLVIGLVLKRNYVTPIEVLTEHLSQLHMGRGDRELNEFRVSRVFRRMVRLVNMIVQKIPATPGALTSSGGAFPAGRDATLADIADLPDPSNDLAAPPEPSLDLGPLMQRPLASPPPPPRAGPPPPQSDMSLVDFSVDQSLLRGLGALKGISEDANAVAASFLEQTPLELPKARGASEIRGAPSSAVSAAAARLGRNDSGLRSNPAGSGTLNPSRESSLSDGDQRELRNYVNDLGSGSPMAPPPGPRMGGSVANAGLGVAGLRDEKHDGGFRSESTVVAAPDDELLAKSAREMTGTYGSFDGATPERTVVAQVPGDLLAQASGNDQGNGEAAEMDHFKETYERFLEMRRACGETTAELSLDRFLVKLRKNRDGLVSKYNCRTVRFQVYRKDGKAALKATPIRH